MSIDHSKLLAEIEHEITAMATKVDVTVRLGRASNIMAKVRALAQTAAAPELLEAVERLCGSLGVMVTDPDNEADIIFGRAAIAKATEVAQVDRIRQRVVGSLHVAEPGAAFPYWNDAVINSLPVGDYALAVALSQEPQND